ncbi:MAG: hypothetical protein A3H31_02225 [Gallionellales bacterium RIFCSPLOWO2_02_FULL_57_47]|nr:MAG: hypothetical protein A3H31_02225 [Gallionellales bacterium RIFCSPLOWO2_02_FULL_57_47]
MGTFFVPTRKQPALTDNKKSVLRDSRLDTVMRSIRCGQACCSALPHRRAAPNRVARAPQGAAQQMTKAYQIDRRGMSDNGVAVKAHIGEADVKLQSSGRNQHATPRFARKTDL